MLLIRTLNTKLLQNIFLIPISIILPLFKKVLDFDYSLTIILFIVAIDILPNMEEKWNGKTRFETGMKNLKKIDGKDGEAIINSLETISPDLGKYIVEFAFGDIYAREGLSLQQREMITLIPASSIASITRST